jgi:hypothetical protein
MHIYSDYPSFFSWSAPWERLELRILTSSVMKSQSTSPSTARQIPWCPQSLEARRAAKGSLIKPPENFYAHCGTSIVSKMILCERIYIPTAIPFYSHLTNSFFKNQVKNGSIKLRANNEKNWPSFLYLEGTVYDELELEKGLFRGHVFLRVRSPIFLILFLHLAMFFMVCALYSQGSPWHLPAIEQLPNLPRKRCTACRKSSQKQLHMLLSR